MSKKILKILTTIIYIMLIISLFYNVYAEGISNAFQGSLDGVNEKNQNSIKDIISAILLIIRIGGALIAVAILMIIACKYMIASAGDRADIKKYAVSYIIGAIILFGASGIAGIIRQVVFDSFGTVK